MATEDGSKKVGGKPQRRGGLGRGLGALIPSAQSEATIDRERPLDVLFPDLRGHIDGRDESGMASALVRGGSARELLNPRQRSSATSVSRETIPPATASASGKTESTARVNEDRPQQSSVSDLDVSRETIPPGDFDEKLVEVPGTTFGMLDLGSIIPNIKQPRQIFEQSELEELADSIAEVGLLQPIVVRPIDTQNSPSEELIAALKENPEARYELIMGERRLRASGLAGLSTIPALVRVTEEENLLRDALLENLHRAQLNPLEEAAAYAQLMEDFSCTQEELSQRIARSRPQIANTLRLLKLPASVQKRVAAGVISAGHARALLSLQSPELMASLGDRIISEGLSVRATEEIVRLMKDGDAKADRPLRASRQPSELAMQVIEQVSDLLDTQVTVTEGKSKGRLVITFADHDDLRRISQLLRSGH